LLEAVQRVVFLGVPELFVEYSTQLGGGSFRGILDLPAEETGQHLHHARGKQVDRHIN
jgi:hypothetical protein